MNESNAVLVQRFRDHDPSAFAELFGRYHSLVFGVCLKMLRHRQDAEDVTQETFSRVARYIHRWDSGKPLEPWLVAIAGNRCRTHLSRQRSHQPLSAAVEPSSNEIDQQQSADSFREEVVLVMGSLPEKQREAFRLFHELELNYAEIAQQMDCPVGTVKTWVHRARRHMIQRLRERDVLEARDQPLAEVK